MAHPSIEHIGILANPTKPGAGARVADMRDAFAAQGFKITLAEATGALLNEGGVPESELADEVDLIAVLGGDGTMLYAAAAAAGKDTPVAGINLGTLGFLTTATLDDTHGFAKAVTRGDYLISERSMVEVTIGGGEEDSPERTFYGLNEMTLSRGEVSHMIELETRVGGEFLNFYHADGLIVSTPTGSTAYSLSAGGPIVSPESDVFILTPVCPHALSDRSVVVSDKLEITISPRDPKEKIVLTVDNQVCERLPPETLVRVRRAPFTLPLVQTVGHRFYEVVHRKLGWRGSRV